jgi:hypothetical protein
MKSLGMVRILSFDDVGEVLDYLRGQQTTADSQVQPWQAEMKVGDYFVRLIPMEDGIVAVYGEVLKPDYDEDEEPNFYDQPHMKHVRFTRCFSMMCPGGELGDTHVASIGRKLSKTQFNLAAQWGWPSDARVRRIVEME